MPRTQSAKKAMRQTKTRTERNRQQRSALRTAIKRVRKAASPAEAKAAFESAEKLIDRAGRKNLIHRNTAARTKSRLAKAIAAKS
ncbi:MAG: 30S ribosomal protein S20 [Gemmatimonadales bacterium]|nr:30S ribosomal protein S20 [Gemmatimonadales bacterium]